MDMQDDYQHWLREWLGWDQPNPDLAVEPAGDDRGRQLLSGGVQLLRFADDRAASAGLK